jgi:hypothetical protein
VNPSPGIPSVGGSFARTPVNIEHPITPLIQPTPVSCWATAVSMLLGEKVPLEAYVDPPGRLILTFQNVQGFARAYKLQLYGGQSWSADGLADLLQRGPFMVMGVFGTGDNAIKHALVVGGISTNGPTILTVYDPANGSKNRVDYEAFIQRFPATASYLLQR